MKRFALPIALSMLCLILLSCAETVQTSEPLLEVVFLDVGQGDSILLRVPSGDILIDAGTEESQQTLCKKLRAYGVTELLLAIFTHPDEDHIGGADGVLSEFPTREIWVPPNDATNEAYLALVAAAEEANSALRYVTAGELRKIDDVVLFTLSPMDTVFGDSNESSIVLKVTCGETSALFMGDAGEKTESAMLDAYGAVHLRCDLYKVGHHGSATSSSQRFLEDIDPEWAVISCGEENPFGHPHGEVLKRLGKIGITVLRTDLLGDVVFASDGERFLYVNQD